MMWAVQSVLKLLLQSKQAGAPLRPCCWQAELRSYSRFYDTTKTRTTTRRILPAVSLDRSGYFPVSGDDLLFDCGIAVIVSLSAASFCHNCFKRCNQNEFLLDSGNKTLSVPYAI